MQFLSNKFFHWLMFAVKAIIVVSDCYLTPILQFYQLYHGENKLILKLDDDEVRFVPDQHADMDFYCASSLKQQSADRYVAPLRHIILIPSQPVFALSP
jgi:hypothetical protein